MKPSFGVPPIWFPWLEIDLSATTAIRSSMSSRVKGGEKKASSRASPMRPRSGDALGELWQRLEPAILGRCSAAQRLDHPPSTSAACASQVCAAVQHSRWGRALAESNLSRAGAEHGARHEPDQSVVGLERQWALGQDTERRGLDQSPSTAFS